MWLVSRNGDITSVLGGGVALTTLYLKSCYVKVSKLNWTPRHEDKGVVRRRVLSFTSRPLHSRGNRPALPPYRGVKRFGGLHMRSECFVDKTIPLLPLEFEAGSLEVNQQCHHSADRDVSLTVVLRSAVRLNQDRWKGMVYSVCVCVCVCVCFGGASGGVRREICSGAHLSTDFSRRTSGEGPIWSSGDALVFRCMSEVLGCGLESVD